MKKILVTGLLFFLSTALSAQTLELLSVTPADGAAGVPTETSIVITFDKKIEVKDNDPGNIEFIQLLSSAEVELTGVDISPDGKIFTFHVTLEEDSDYTLAILGAEAEDGSGLEGIHLSRFTTAQEIGQYTVKGSLSLTDETVFDESGFAVITLTKEKPVLAGNSSDDIELTYVSVLTDLENYSFEIPYVREGEYYPVGFQPESQRPVYYFYDTDSNVETPDKITVNSSTAPGNILTGVTLHQIIFELLTFEDARALAQGIEDELETGSVLFTAETADDLWRSDTPPLLDGISDYWRFYYYNPVSDNFYEVHIQPEGASVEGTRPMDELGYSLPGSAYLPVPANTIDSDTAVGIAEVAGGQSFRFGYDGMHINLNAAISHEYGMYIQNLQEAVPAAWVIRYNVMDSNHGFIDEFKIFIDAETGDVLHSEERGITVKGQLTAHDIPALKELIGNKTVSVYLTSQPQQFNIGNPWIQNVEAHSIVDSETLTYSFYNIPDGIYYPIAIIEDDGTLDMPAFFLYDIDNNLLTQDSLEVNSGNAVNKVISDIDLAYWEIKPITFSESLPLAEAVLPGDKLFWRASFSRNIPEHYFSENTYTGTGAYKNWDLVYYTPATDEAIYVASNPINADIVNLVDASSEYPAITATAAGEVHALVPDHIIDSNTAIDIIDDELGSLFVNYFKNEPGVSFQLDLHLNPREFAEVNYSYLDLSLPESVRVYWVGVYNAWFGSTSHTLHTFIDAETGDIIATHGFERPEFTTFTVSGTIASDDPEALKATIADESVSVYLTLNKPLENTSEQESPVIAYTTTLDKETLSFSFSEVEPGSYYIISSLEVSENDTHRTFFVYDTDNDFATEESITVNIETAPTGVLSGIVLQEMQQPVAVSNEELSSDLPSETKLLQNYPNPFNPSTTIPFTLQKAGFVELAIYNITGQKVATLINKNLQAGSHTVSWDASQYASGVYLYRFTANGVIQTRTLTLIK